MRQVAQMVLKRGEPRDGLSPDLEGRDAVGDPLLGRGQDLQDRLTQPGQRRALGLLQSIQVLIDLLGRHGPILLTAQPMSKERNLGNQMSPLASAHRAGTTVGPEPPSGSAGRSGPPSRRCHAAGEI
jgi:hypothetical protein